MHADLDVCAEDIAALFAAQQPVARPGAVPPPRSARAPARVAQRAAGAAAGPVCRLCRRLRQAGTGSGAERAVAGGRRNRRRHRRAAALDAPAQGVAHLADAGHARADRLSAQGPLPDHRTMELSGCHRAGAAGLGAGGRQHRHPRRPNSPRRSTRCCASCWPGVRPFRSGDGAGRWPLRSACWPARSTMCSSPAHRQWGGRSWPPLPPSWPR